MFSCLVELLSFESISFGVLAHLILLQNFDGYVFFSDTAKEQHPMKLI